VLYIPLVLELIENVDARGEITLGSLHEVDPITVHQPPFGAQWFAT